jgi:hypothetical protein
MLNTIFSAYIDGIKSSAVGLWAYHCEAGHVFLVIGSEFRLSEAVPDGNGHTVIV